ncbi:MAG: Tim44 domain-containing protein [Burkholderiales bacterium]|nr:Tim44 domain-containing protein [Burkholderiales bacterium]
MHSILTFCRTAVRAAPAFINLTETIVTKPWIKRAAIAVFAGLMTTAMTIPEADAAKRFGGGRNVGKQSDNVNRQAAPAAPAKQQQAQAAPAQTPPAAAPAAAGNRWLGPLAGIAAGLGIAALLSHLGLGGAFAEALMMFLMIGLAILAAVFIFRMIKRGNAPAAATVGAGPGAGQTPATAMPFSAAPAQPAGPAPARSLTEGITLRGAGEAAPAPAPATSTAGGGSWITPEGFDTENFLHIAKMYFVRMQAAWDAGNEKDLRDFTTPEVYAEVKLDLVARGAEESVTEVVSLDAQFLGVEELGDTTMASVRLSGTIREGRDAPAMPFAEVWNLTKPASARASWVVAGIQQESATKH